MYRKGRSISWAPFYPFPFARSSGLRCRRHNLQSPHPNVSRHILTCRRPVCVCVCVCECVFVCVCVRDRERGCPAGRTNFCDVVREPMHARSHARPPAVMHARTHTHMHARTHTHLHTCNWGAGATSFAVSDTYTHMPTHKHILTLGAGARSCTHTHTHKRSLSFIYTHTQCLSLSHLGCRCKLLHFLSRA